VYPVISVVRDYEMSEILDEATRGHEEDTIVGFDKTYLGAVVVDSVFPNCICISVGSIVGTI
jgi:hypothetical protein